MNKTVLFASAIAVALMSTNAPAALAGNSKAEIQRQLSLKAYKAWKHDNHGEKAMKSGVLYTIKSVGQCGDGFVSQPGLPGDKTCHRTNGRLRCPNKCVPDPKLAEQQK
jgi:hypothetical protein